MVTPEPVTLRVRRSLVAPEEMRDRLGERGFRVEPVAGLPDYLRVLAAPGSVAQTLEHWLGFLHVQQAVMALPVLALGARPGDRVLDLCAAPGGKTSHLAEAMGERGCLLAVDPKEKRLRGLMSNLFRLGHSNVVVVAADAREIRPTARFDRVLVDAPCSGEGNVRRQRGRLPKHRRGFRNYVTGLQEALLRNAVRLVRPGGTVVYSTCTFAPEENEGVLDRVLSSEPVRLEPIPLDLPHAPGIPAWEGQPFDPSVAGAWRVYPHQLDSGGLFMARLRRVGGAPVGEDLTHDGRRERPSGIPGPPVHESESGATPGEDGWSAVPGAFPGEHPSTAESRVERVGELLVSEYGVRPERVEALGWMVRKENVWMQTAGEWPVESWPDDGGWRVVSVGLRAFRSAGGGKETPSNQLLSRLRAEIGGPRRVELSNSQLHHLLDGGAIQEERLPAGPVVLFHEGTLLGRGMVGRRGLRHEIPRARASRLAAILEPC